MDGRLGEWGSHSYLSKLPKPSYANEEASGRESWALFTFFHHCSKWCSHVHHAPQPNKPLLLRFSWSLLVDGLTRGARASVYCRLIDVCWYYFIVYMKLADACRRGEGNCQKIVPYDCHEIRLDCARLGWKFRFNSAAQTYTPHTMLHAHKSQLNGRDPTANPNTETPINHRCRSCIVD